MTQENNKLKEKLKNIDEALNKVITIKIYTWVLIGMALLCGLIKNYFGTFLNVILIYLIIKLKNRYKNYLLEEDDK